MTQVLSPVFPLAGQEKAYQRELNQLAKQLKEAIRDEVLNYLKAQDNSWIIDGVGETLGSIFDRLNERFGGGRFVEWAKRTADGMVRKLVRSTDERFFESFQSATGVDPSIFIAAEGLEDFVQNSIASNVTLIKSLPAEYLKSVETIVNNGYRTGLRYSEIEKQITARVGSTNSKLSGRIKTIARNEVQTINSQVALRRSASVGVKEGIYRTSRDERVRKCHKELNGHRFVLKKGAWSTSCQKYIIPGVTDINCRCSYSPIFEGIR